MADDFPSYFGVAPSPQNALDLFKGEWSTRLPDDTGLVASTGPMRGCEDYRVEWFERLIGGFTGKRILELGPLEGGHAYMAEKRGAAEIVSIEANPRAYLKCLLLKEIFGLQRARFLLGDFTPYLRDSREQFDAVFACGVLYHMTNPVELIQLITQHARTAFVWTHCYEAEYFTAHPQQGSYFAPGHFAGVGGYPHTLHRKRYGESKDWKGFCGGGAMDAAWLTRDEILGAFEHFGFRIIECIDEQNPNGPAILFAAEKR